MIVGNIRECIKPVYICGWIGNPINQYFIDFVTGIGGKSKILAASLIDRYRAAWRDTASASCRSRNGINDGRTGICVTLIVLVIPLPVTVMVALSDVIAVFAAAIMNLSKLQMNKSKNGI